MRFERLSRVHTILFQFDVKSFDYVSVDAIAAQAMW